MRFISKFGFIQRDPMLDDWLLDDNYHWICCRVNCKDIIGNYIYDYRARSKLYAYARTALSV